MSEHQNILDILLDMKFGFVPSSSDVSILIKGFSSMMGMAADSGNERFVESKFEEAHSGKKK